MNKLKILQLADHSEIISGGAKQMLLLTRGLVELGHEVTCVFHDAPSPLEKTLDQVLACGGKLVRFPMGKKSYTPQLVRFIHEHGFDIVHTHRAAYKVLLRSCRDGDLPPVIINRGHSRPVREKEYQRLTHHSVRGMVAVADHVRRVLLDGGMSEDLVHVVYGSYLPEEFDRTIDGNDIRHAWMGERAESHRLVGVIAKLSQYKSHDVFLRAAARVLRRHPKTMFAIVGHDPDGVSSLLQRQAGALGQDLGVDLLSSLIFTGPRQDIPKVLAALDISVSASASAHEGLSGVMRESLAMARPVVCTDVGGNRELVRHEETGLLVAPNDDSVLANAVSRLLEQPVWARSLAEKGFVLATTIFSNPARARRIEQIYLRALQDAEAA